MFLWLRDHLIEQALATPYTHLEGYMYRYWLIPYKKSEVLSWFKRPVSRLLQEFGIAARVHLITSSDDDRAFHDHPWSFMSVILKGKYIEHTPVYSKDGKYLGDHARCYREGNVLFRSHKFWHRLELVKNSPCFTLFITMRRKQNWGFQTNNGGKINSKEYLKNDLRK